jgi:hypothetical protein
MFAKANALMLCSKQLFVFVCLTNSNGGTNKKPTCYGGLCLCVSYGHFSSCSSFVQILLQENVGIGPTQKTEGLLLLPGLPRLSKR